MNKFENNSKLKKEAKKRSEVPSVGRMSTRINKIVDGMFKFSSSDNQLDGSTEAFKKRQKKKE
jgi:hypothetical protein